MIFEGASSDMIGTLEAAVVHPGRSWAEKCKGKTPTRESLLKGIEAFLSKVGESTSLPMDPSGGDAFA